MSTPLERMMQCLALGREQRARWRQFVRMWQRVGEWAA